MKSVESPLAARVRDRVVVVVPGGSVGALRDKIDACEGLIQMVGQGYGAEPPTVDAEYVRVSYTQFVPLRPVAETTAWTNLSAWCWTIRPKRCWRIWAPGAPKKPIDASYKLLVIISQGCATYSGDCLFKNTVEAVIRN